MRLQTRGRFGFWSGVPFGGRAPLRTFASSGFTLVEVLVTVFILSILLGVAYPSLAGMRDQNSRLRCLSNLRQIQAAKDSYALDHIGEGNPEGAADREAVFRTYFVEGFTTQSVCPVTGETYSGGIYRIYERTTCSTCGNQEMGGGP
jgi:prepilin-type N-terminal cleavage/methylation domain-containing protein